VSVALCAVAAYTSTYGREVQPLDGAAMRAALVAAAAGGLAVYWRFGYVYAAIGGIACAAAVPFHLSIPAPAQHALAAAVLAAIFLAARRQRQRYDEEYPGDDYALIQAAACAG